MGGVHKLTIEEKQRILLAHIFGVDIDEQAVEVAKLSLNLKLLEDEGAEAASRQELFRHSDLKMLPSLAGNVKCGKFKSLYQKWDLYIPFMEKALSILKKDGIYSQIIPYPFTNQIYAKLMRSFILQNYHLIEIADLKGAKVFKNATVTNCIPIIKKESGANTVIISHINQEKEILFAFNKNMVELVIDKACGVWNLEEQTLNSKRHADLHVLGDFCYISYGLRPNSDEKTAKGKFKKEDLISDVMDAIHPRKYIEAKDFSRYSINRVRYLEYGTKRSSSQY